MKSAFKPCSIATSVGILGLLLLTGCSNSQKGGGFAMPPMPVEAATVSRQTITDEFTAVGTLRAIKAIEVVSEIDGKIMDLPFHEGSSIALGELIAQIDDAQLRAERDRAQALLEQQKVTFDRAKELTSQNLTSKQTLDDASAAYKVAEANLGVAEVRLDKTRIVAPFAGQIGARKVSVGEFLRIGEPITELAQLDNLKAIFSAPERFLARLHKGSAVTVTSPAFPDVKLEGEINVIDPVVNASTRSVNIVALVPNHDRLLRPGMSADVRVVLSRREGALVIPAEAVFAEGNQMYVFAIGDSGMVAKTPVQLGSRTAQDVEVQSGLTENQQVVRAGHQKLFQGAKVLVAPPPGSAPPGGAGTTAGTPPADTGATKDSVTAGT